MRAVIAEFEREHRRNKSLTEGAIEQFRGSGLFQRIAPSANPAAVVVKHLAGNLTSRWTDFPSADGEKPGRNRDAEFVLTDDDTEESLERRWESGRAALSGALAALTDADLARTTTIRGEVHTVLQAVLRGTGHTAYQVGQVL